LKKILSYVLGTLILGVIANEIFYRLHLPSIQPLLISQWQIPHYLGCFLRLPEGTILFAIIIIVATMLYLLTLSTKNSVDKETKHAMHEISYGLVFVIVFLLIALCLKSCDATLSPSTTQATEGNK